MRRLPIIAVALFALAAVVVAGVGLAAAADSTQGKLVAVYPDRQVLVLTETNGRDQKTFAMASNVQVFINDQPADVAELQPGEFVIINYEMQSDRLVATEVRCQRF